MRLIRLLKKDLAEEVLEWVEDDIITSEQATKICDRYDIDFAGIHDNSVGYNILVGLGILFIGLAAITLIGANWQDIPRGLRMWGLIFLTISIQGWGLIKYNREQTNASTSLFFLGNIFYGASIVLIAQVYHLGEHMPDGIFWWAIGCLPIALLLNSSWLTLFSFSLGLLWFILEVEMGFYPYFFPLFILSTFTILVRGKENIILFFVTLVGVVMWLEYTLSLFWSKQGELDFYPEHIAISVAFSVFIYSCGHLLEANKSSQAKSYAALVSNWSLRFGLLFTLGMSFSSPWKYLTVADWNHLPSMWIVLTLFLLLSVLITLPTKQIWSLGGGVIFFVLILAMVIFYGDKNHSLYLQVLFNILLILAGIRLIFLGINRGISHHFFLGVVTISITALVRYIDLVGSYIGGSILFTFFSVLLLGSALYWKKCLGARGQDDA